MSRLRVTVSPEKCQSYRRCNAVAPAVFGIGSDGKASVLHPQGAPDEEILRAARACPYRAITVSRESGEQLFPPPPKARVPP